jgi:hypothetical protein
MNTLGGARSDKDTDCSGGPCRSLICWCLAETARPSSIYVTPELCSFQTFLAAERALNDFVENMAHNYSLRVRSVFDPLPLTASEQWMYDRSTAGSTSPTFTT